MNRWMIGIASFGLMTSAPAWGQQPKPEEVRSSARRVAVEAVGYAPVAAAPATPAKKEKAVSLGIDVAPAAAAMREQLKLPRGVGLTVTVVHADGPGKAAGVEQHDALEKLNDQWLINPPQLHALVRGMKPGEEVTLTIVRQGERKTVKAKVEEREQAVAAFVVDHPWVGADVHFTPAKPAVPQDWILQAAPGHAGAFAGVAGNDVVFFRTIDGEQTTEWADDEVTIAIRRKDDKVSKLTVTDKKTGTIVYDGPKEGMEKQLKPPLLKKVEQAEATAPPQPPQPVPAPPVLAPQPTRVRMDDGMRRRTVVLNGADFDLVDGGGLTVLGGGRAGTTGAGRGKVVRWQDDAHVLVMRLVGTRPAYLLALSRKDGRVVYDGPVASDEQRKSLPAEVAEEFGMLVAHPETAKEFGAAAADDKKAEPAKLPLK